MVKSETKKDKAQRTILHISALPFYTVDERKKSGMPSLQNTVRYFAKKGWKSVFLYPTATKQKRKNEEDNWIFPIYFPFFPSDGNDVLNRLKMRFFNLIYMLFFIFFIYKIVFKIKPDIIYSLGASAVLPSKILGRILRVPVVSRLYGIALSNALKRNKISSWKEFKELYWAVPEWVALKLRVDAYVITDDGSDGIAIAKKFGVHNRSFFARNGVDPIFVTKEEIEGLRHRLLNNKFEKLILYLGRIDSGKRCDRILQVAELAKLKNFQWRFILIGEGPEKVRLDIAAREKGLSEEFIEIGAVPHEKIWEYLQAADVFLSLPDHSVISNTLLEAISVGIPVVIGKKGVGLKDLIETSRTNAYLVDNPDNIADVLKGIKIVMERERTQPKAIFETWEQRLSREEDFLFKMGCI